MITALSSKAAMASNKFTTEPDSSLQCVICLEVAEDPRQHGKCGRLFCKECLEKLGRDKPCPNCRMKHPQYFEDNRSKREIMALRIRCNINSKCEWEGTVGTLQEHVAECEFALVPCPKQCKDANNKVEDFMRKDLDEHLKMRCPNRDYACQYCKVEGPYIDIMEVHDKTCKKKVLPCPNADCDETMERQQVTEHVDECPHTVLPCKYQEIGCDAEMKRKDLAAHIQDDRLHLHMALETVTWQQVAISSQQDAIDSQQDTIDSQQDAIDSQQDTIDSQQDAIDTQRVAIDLLQSTVTSLEGDMGLLKGAVNSQEVTVGSLVGTQKFNIESIQDTIKLQHSLLNEKQDVVVLKKRDSITFALSQFQNRKEKGDIIIFPPFYTHPYGYHMALKVYANGSNSGAATHVSVYIKMLVGKYDAGLNWPFIGSVIVTLLNQLEDDKHHSKTTKFRARENLQPGKILGTPKLIPHMDLDRDELDLPQYLKDDTLYFRVSVEVADHKPWLECTNRI